MLASALLVLIVHTLCRFHLIREHWDKANSAPTSITNIHHYPTPDAIFCQQCIDHPCGSCILSSDIPLTVLTDYETITELQVSCKLYTHMYGRQNLDRRMTRGQYSTTNILSLFYVGELKKQSS